MPTDFSRFGPAQLAQMLAAGDPMAVRARGDLWADVAGSLYSRAGDLEQQLREFEPYWTGSAADQYRSMLRSLITGVRQIADVARLITDGVYTAGETLATARRSGPTAPVLAELARVYAALEAALPPLPDIAPPPAAEEVLAGGYRPDPTLLFSDVYRNGLATAAAALGGRFSSAVPRIVGSPSPATPAAGAEMLPSAAASPAPAGPASVAPVAYDAPSRSFGPPSLSFGPPSSSIGRASVEPPGLSNVDAVEAPAPVVAPTQNPGTSLGGGFFPPMIPPYGMGGGGDGFGSGRHVPHWLTEPEPEIVFGVPLQAVISVIGAEPQQPAPPPPIPPWGR